MKKKIKRKYLPQQVIDFETTGTQPYKGDQIFSFCIGRMTTNFKCFVDVYRLDNKDKKENARNWKILRNFFSDMSIEKIAHNYKFELSFCKRHSINVPEETVWHDTMIIHQLLRNNAPAHALDFVCWEMAGYPRTLDKDVKEAYKRLPKEKKEQGYLYIDKKLMTEYQMADGERPFIIFCSLFDKIKNDAKLYADYLNEIKLIKYTQEMEQYGIKIDVDEMENLKQWMKKELYQNEIKTAKHYGNINLSSTKQLSNLLFNKMKKPIMEYTAKGAPSLGKEVILKMDEKEPDEPIYRMILKHRSYTKGIATVNNYISFLSRDETIHPNIKTNHAATGREACDNPNLQNVSKDQTVGNLFPIPLRRVFHTRRGRILFFVDYAGIEMRLIIEATREPELYKRLIDDPGFDFHHPTVECFLGISEAADLKKKDYKNYKMQRSAYKNTGFCIAYGGGTEKVAYTLKKSIDEIKKGDAKYRQRFRRIAIFSRKMSAIVDSKGYIETPFGRKLWVNRDKPYIASNYFIQGMAAGILKRAQVNVGRWIKKEYGDRLRMVLPIHDEIVFSMSRELLKEKTDIYKRINEIMIDMPEINVPLRTEVKETKTSWADAKEVKTLLESRT